MLFSFWFKFCQQLCEPGIPPRSAAKTPGEAKSVSHGHAAQIQWGQDLNLWPQRVQLSCFVHPDTVTLKVGCSSSDMGCGPPKIEALSTVAVHAFPPFGAQNVSLGWPRWPWAWLSSFPPAPPPRQPVTGENLLTLLPRWLLKRLCKSLEVSALYFQGTLTTYPLTPSHLLTANTLWGPRCAGPVGSWGADLIMRQGSELYTVISSIRIASAHA